MAQQAFAQIPDVVKRVRVQEYFPVKSHTEPRLPQFIVHFYQAVQENNLAEITVSYESGWNRLTEKYYAKTEWPEAELIAPLVNDGAYPHLFPPLVAYFLLRLDPIFLILYRELYYRHVYSRLQPNLDDRFHSYENSCELFNYLLSARVK